VVSLVAWLLFVGALAEAFMSSCTLANCLSRAC